MAASFAICGFPGARRILGGELLPKRMLRRMNIVRGSAMTGVLCHRQQHAIVTAVQVYGERHVERHRVVTTI